jgi:hypothetical protein
MAPADSAHLRFFVRLQAYPLASIVHRPHPHAPPIAGHPLGKCDVRMIAIHPAQSHPWLSTIRDPDGNTEHGKQTGVTHGATETRAS